MKKLILIPIIALIFASCSKQSIEQNRPAAIYSDITFTPAYAGSSMSIKFTFNLSVPVKKINLYRSPETLVYYINNAAAGKVTMYDHVIDSWPTYTQNYHYQFEFIMEDGTTSLSEKFQVY